MKRARKKTAGPKVARIAATQGRGRAARAAKVTPRQLMAAAERARMHAYAPYSGFKVGAALLTRDGRIIEGCNVENAAFGLSMCAERNAVAKAVGEGLDHFEAIAVTAGPGKGVTPCGSCRQVLHEFAPHIRVYWRDGRGGITRVRLATLLGRPFGPKRLTR